MIALSVYLGKESGLKFFESMALAKPKAGLKFFVNTIKPMTKIWDIYL